MIKRVCIIDDEQEGRTVLKFAVEETDMEPVLQQEGVSDLHTFINQFIQSTDAVISDHHLRKRTYFPVDGAQLIAACYEKKIPGILVTRYFESDINEIRPYRQMIPIILTPDEIDPQTIITGFDICCREFKGELTEFRKAWRTLVRVDDVQNDHIYVIVPAWNPNVTITLYKQNMPQGFQNLKGEDRVYAKVNIGADVHSDLYFKDWEK